MEGGVAMKSIITTLTASAVIAAAAKVRSSLPLSIVAAVVYLIALALYICRKPEIEAAEFNRVLEREGIGDAQPDTFQMQLEREKLFRWYERHSA